MVVQSIEAAFGILIISVQCITENDLSPSVVAVGGVLLKKDLTESESSDNNPRAGEDREQHLVMVTSTESTLRRMALVIANSEALLLVGAVGCGKTSLIEHVAALTGRTRAPQLMKIQLGDQTDSKVSHYKLKCKQAIVSWIFKYRLFTSRCWGRTNARRLQVSSCGWRAASLEPFERVVGSYWRTSTTLQWTSCPPLCLSCSRVPLTFLVMVARFVRTRTSVFLPLKGKLTINNSNKTWCKILMSCCSDS